MILVDNKYELIIRIEDEVLEELGVLLQKIEIYENVWQSVPTAKLEFVSTAFMVEDQPICDGMRVEVQLRALTQGNEADDELIKFRVFDFEIIHSIDAFIYVIDLIYDVADLYQSKVESIEGTSADVFRAFAARNNLDHDIDFTQDLQVWIRPNVRGLIWLNQISNHAWSSAESCYVWCIRKSGELILHNLAHRKDEQYKWQFLLERLQDSVDPKDHQIFIQDFKLRVNSGTFNSLFGYGRNSLVFDLESGDYEDQQVGVITKSVRHLQLNKDQLQPQRSDTVPHRIGNTHSNYEAAQVAESTHSSTLFDFD